MSFRTLDDLTADQRVLARLDLNAPVEDGQVQDTKRFERHATTVRELLDADHRLALLAHQGRPGRDTYVSLEQHAEILSDHVGQAVGFVADTTGADALSAIRALDAGEALLLENVRFLDDELADRTPAEHAESDLVQTLAPEFDAYVNDAYSAAHRAHASLVGFPEVMDAYAGRVMEREYEYNSSIQAREFDGQVTMVLGGTKADDLIGVMEGVRDTVDTYLMGGVIAELFLRAKGYDLGYDVDGSDLFDDQWDANREEIERLVDAYGDDIVLPSDLAYEDADGGRAEDEVGDIEKEHAYLDVGTGTVESYDPVIGSSEAVFVKGALGVFENEQFADGTRRVLERVAATDCFSVVGGGDTARAIDMYGLDENDFSHVSIAGGAYVRALTGDELVAVEALERAAERMGGE